MGHNVRVAKNNDKSAPVVATKKINDVHYPIYEKATTSAALGEITGYVLWNKFGYNNDVDSATPEVVASFGGSIDLSTAASALKFYSSSANDTNGGTGCNSIVIYAVNEDWDASIEVLALSGATTVTSTANYIGYPNRLAMYLCGSGQVNDGNITCKRTSDDVTTGYMPAGEGVTQQCVFTIPKDNTFVTEWLYLGAAKEGTKNPLVEFKFWVYSAISNGKQEVFRKLLDTSVEVELDVSPSLPFPITEKCICWIEASSDKDNTMVTGRFSGNLIADDST